MNTWQQTNFRRASLLPIAIALNIDKQSKAIYVNSINKKRADLGSFTE
jgi:hypothetical protein